MKQFFFLGMMCASLGAQAQAISYPSNPDMDNDGMVGIDDLFQVLAHFGEFVGVGADAPAPDYSLFPEFEGTIYQLWNETTVMDSVYLHFRCEGVHEYYPIGSLELLSDTLVYERSLMLYPNWQNFQSVEVSWRKDAQDGGKYLFNLWHYGDDNGTYRVDLIDFTTTGNYLQSIGFKNANRSVVEWHITEDADGKWTMDEAGWHFNFDHLQGAPLVEFECVPYLRNLD